MKVERAPDIEKRINEIIAVLSWEHIIQSRIICMRSFNSKCNAYARIWNLPKIWQKALEVNPFYIIEVLSENFDSLPEEKKTKILIHELLHIPKKFSGGLVPHKHRGGSIDNKTINQIYLKFKKLKSEKGHV